MEADERRRILEALLLAAPEPLPATRIASILPDTPASAVRACVAELNAAYEADGRGFRIEEVGGGYQLRTLRELAPWLQKLRPQPPLRMSRAALETLAICAYKQPITRAELEHVRGVDVGAVLHSLIERRLVRIAGHREVPGRPMLYATTRRFLEVFGLASLSDLPTLREIEELLRDRTPEAGAGEGAVLAEALAAASADPDGAVDGAIDDDESPEASDGAPTTH